MVRKLQRKVVSRYTQHRNGYGDSNNSEDTSKEDYTEVSGFFHPVVMSIDQRVDTHIQMKVQEKPQE